MPNFKVALPNGEEFDFEVLDGKDGLPGEKGEKGDTGPRGEKGEPGRDGRDGKDGINGINGRDGLDGKDGKDGTDGKDGKDGVDAKFSLIEIKKIAKELSKDSNLAWQTIPHLNSVVAGNNITVDSTDPLNPVISSTGGPGGGAEWGSITGTLSDQTDLNSALSGKSDTSHNHSGVYAPALGPDENYVTDAQLIVIGNTSGTNTGDNATNSQYSGLASSKQDTLVSGTNIKSVNGESLLGGGNIVISGSGISAMQARTISLFF